MVKEWDKKDVARRKALSLLQTKSPMLSATSDQKSYLEKVKEERMVKEEMMSQDEEEDRDNEVGKDHVYPHIKGQRGHEGEKLWILFPWFAVENTDPQGHEGI